MYIYISYNENCGLIVTFWPISYCLGASLHADSHCRIYLNRHEIDANTAWSTRGIISARVIIFYKAHHLGQPSYISDLLHQYVPLMSLRSSFNQLTVTTSAAKTTERHFSSAVSWAWNSLPVTVRTAILESFNSQLKTHSTVLTLTNWRTICLSAPQEITSMLNT